MNEEAKIDYQDLIDLGFKRTDHSDSVYYRRHGVDWFIVEMKLSKRWCIDWDQETRQCTLYRHKKGSVQVSMDIKSLEELKRIIKIFKWKKD